ncbi:hypothetical protein [Nocardia sp. X0981]
MNTATSAFRTGTREDATGRAPSVPIQLGETGTDGPAGGGLPVRTTPRVRPPRPCPAVPRGSGAGGRAVAMAPRPAVAHRCRPARPPQAAPATPAELVERARAGYAATALTAVVSAAVVVAFLALAHLRAPDPAPAPAVPAPPVEVGAP